MHYRILKGNGYETQVDFDAFPWVQALPELPCHLQPAFSIGQGKRLQSQPDHRIPQKRQPDQRQLDQKETELPSSEFQ